MKYLPLKLSTLVVLLFSGVIATCLLWTPVKIRYYTAKLRSENPEIRVAGVDKLFGMGDAGQNALSEYYKCSIEEIKFIKEHWSSPNWIKIVVYVGHYPLPPLHLAVEKDFAVAVNLLIDKGADPNVLSPYHETPLYRAVNVGNKDLVVQLYSRGGDVNETAMFDSPLISAVADNNFNIARFLVEKGAKLNWTWVSSRNKCELFPWPLTALDFVIMGRHKEFADYLRLKGGKTGKESKAEQEKM
jgi:hypothetical protein